MRSRSRLVIAALPVLAFGCATEASLEPPPLRPQPISSFEVEFTPSGVQTYPPTKVTEVKRYKTIAHWPGRADWVSDAEEPSRPYVPVGQLRTKLAWHWLEEGVSSCAAEEGLVAYHIGAVGGHAILLCEVDEQARGVLKNPDNGRYMTVSYRALTLDVIRFTAR